MVANVQCQCVEIQKGFIYGPFKQPPFTPHMVSPIGVATHYIQEKRDLFWISPHHPINNK